MNAGERLVTVLVTVAVPAAADPEDAAALVADAAVSTALDVVHAVGVEGHLPVAGSTVVPIGTSQPAAVLAVGEGSALLRHLDGEVRQVPLPGLAPTRWTRPTRTRGSSPKTPSDTTAARTHIQS